MGWAACGFKGRRLKAKWFTLKSRDPEAGRKKEYYDFS